MNQFPSEVHRVVNLGTFTTTYGHAADQTQKWMTYSRSQNMAIVNVPDLVVLAKSVQRYLGVHLGKRLEMDAAKNN